MPVRKPTELVATSDILLKRFENKICKNEHEHLQLVGGNAVRAQKWTWNMCDLIAKGIQELVKQQATAVEAKFPTVSVGTGDGGNGEEQPSVAVPISAHAVYRRM